LDSEACNPKILNPEIRCFATCKVLNLKTLNPDSGSMQPSNRGPLHKEEGWGRYEGEMKAVVHAYVEVMKLIRHLPPRTRSYYFQFARENFVTYNQEQNSSVICLLLLRAPSSIAKFPSLHMVSWINCRPTREHQVLALKRDKVLFWNSNEWIWIWIWIFGCNVHMNMIMVRLSHLKNIHQVWVGLISKNIINDGYIFIHNWLICMLIFGLKDIIWPTLIKTPNIFGLFLNIINISVVIFSNTKLIILLLF